MKLYRTMNLDYFKLLCIKFIKCSNGYYRNTILKTNKTTECWIVDVVFKKCYKIVTCFTYLYFSGWIKSILPKTALMVEEEAWNAYPYTKTRYTCPFVEKFYLEIETYYFPDNGHQENVFKLSGSDLRNRIVGKCAMHVCIWTDTSKGIVWNVL